MVAPWQIKAESETTKEKQHREAACAAPPKQKLRKMLVLAKQGLRILIRHDQFKLLLLLLGTLLQKSLEKTLALLTSAVDTSFSFNFKRELVDYEQAEQEDQNEDTSTQIDSNINNA